MTGLRPSRGAAAVAIVLVLVAAAVVSAQEQGPAVPEGLATKPLRETLCWTCHEPWTPPMRDPFIAIQPPETTGGALDSEFNWTVQFQMTWNPKPSVPHLIFVDPYLDLTNAPSLRFGGGPKPVVGYTENHQVVVDATKINQPQSNVTKYPVAAGVTSLRWAIVPQDTSATGPDLALLIRGPGANETLVVDANHTAGSGESHTFTLAELEKLGGGNWTVGARVTNIPSPTNPTAPQANSVGFTVTEDARFDTAALKRLANPHPSYTPGGGLVLQKWTLKFVQQPAPGESVHVGFDTVAWYKHTPPVTGGDFGGITQGVDVNVTTEGGTPVLFQKAVVKTGRAAPVNHATGATISEAVGYASAFLLISSIVSGGMFGQASRRGLNAIFQSAKRRVAFHNFLSYGLTVAALAHVIIFTVPLVPGGADSGEALHRLAEDFQWTKGLVWGGGLAILAMLGLGVTGALQVPMIRRWSYPTWKWWHYGLTVAAIVFTLSHMVLEGRNFGVAFPGLQEPFSDPFYHPGPEL